MMKHPKYIIILFIGIFFMACEKDDVCLQPMTPKAVIRFYDFTSQNDIKSVDNLTIITLPIKDTLYKNVNKDSIALDLNVNENQTKFLFLSVNNKDTIVFNYQRNDVFVSKTCGYKTIFKQLNVLVIPDSDNWIKNITNQTEITADTIADVKIYH